MGIASGILLWCSEQRWLGEQAQRRRFTRRAVRRFMPGEDLDSALAAAGEFRARGIATVFTELGENVTNEAQAAQAAGHYRHALQRIAELGLDTHVSVKLTHLGLDQSEETAFRHLMDLAEDAERHDRIVWIDMEGSAYTDRTLAIFRRARSESPRVALCLQAYLYRTARDLEELLPLAPRIRLVKGAYREPPEIAFPRRREVDESFYRLAETMLDESSRRAGASLALATHDEKLIHRIAETASQLGAPKADYEIQMLYGIQRRLQNELAASGHRVRVLISYGSEWFPWYMRRLAERPANVWFVLRNLVSAG